MTTSRLLIIAGISLTATGLLLSKYPGFFSWFGKLPGDIRIEGNGYAFYFPLVSMLIVSIIVSVLVNWLTSR